jgi:hypothetical protein
VSSGKLNLADLAWKTGIVPVMENGFPDCFAPAESP